MANPSPADAIRSWAEAEDADIYAHFGPMMPPAGTRLIELAGRPRRSRALFVVCTFGGVARTSYRMMRALRHAYEHVAVLVPGACKSAGTLLAIGADELIMTGAAELGPLDVQILKDDEFLHRRSGLVPGYSFMILRKESFEAFETAFVEQKGMGLTTSTAAETAAALAVGLFSGIYSQIDPMRLGESAMANMEAKAYADAMTTHEGERRANVKKGAIEKLIQGYPTHDYVIDRDEARTLFHNVRTPSREECALLSIIKPDGMWDLPPREPWTDRITPPVQEPRESHEDHHDADNGPAPTPQEVPDAHTEAGPGPERAPRVAARGAKG